jgi:hypothetical protein
MSISRVEVRSVAAMMRTQSTWVAKTIMSSAASLRDGTGGPVKCGCDDRHLRPLALKVFFDVNNSTLIDGKIWQLGP